MSELASAAPLRETAPAATAWSVVRVANRPSLLDTEFAGEILEIILPTSTCMFLVIFLVRLLNVGQQDFSASTSLGQVRSLRESEILCEAYMRPLLCAF